MTTEPETTHTVSIQVSGADYAALQTHFARPEHHRVGRPLVAAIAVERWDTSAVAEAEAAIDAWERAADADAGFDAGEFSGPAHARRLDAALDAIAARHGLTRDRLDEQLRQAEEPETRYVETVFTVHPTTDEHLETDEGIRDEFTSWLQGLGAAVHHVTVRPADANRGKEE
jgi:hypothetical protein